jgi:hypothetical protein
MSGIQALSSFLLYSSTFAWVSVQKNVKALEANKKIRVKIISYGTGKYCRISVVTCWNDHYDVLL